MGSSEIALYTDMLKTATAIALTSASVSANTGSADNGKGEMICHQGYVSDVFCLERGAFLDKEKMLNLTVDPLEFPEEHTIHCLIEATPCRSSGYELLAPPTTEGGKAVRKYSLTQEGNDMIVQEGCSLGVGMGDAIPLDKLAKGF